MFTKDRQATPVRDWLIRRVARQSGLKVDSDRRLVRQTPKGKHEFHFDRPMVGDYLSVHTWTWRSDVPKGPQGQDRPADVIGAAVRVAKIATGEVKETLKEDRKIHPNRAAGAEARAASLSSSKRSEIARRAATARWAKSAAG